MRTAGRSSFPATVHIGDAAVGLSNGSALAWRCTLVLGRDGSYRVTVDVDGGATREVAYEEFQALDCSDSTGRPHWWIFN